MSLSGVHGRDLRTGPVIYSKMKRSTTKLLHDLDLASVRMQRVRAKSEFCDGSRGCYSYISTRARTRRKFTREVSHDRTISSAESPRLKRSSVSALTSRRE